MNFRWITVSLLENSVVKDLSVVAGGGCGSFDCSRSLVDRSCGGRSPVVTVVTTRWAWLITKKNPVEKIGVQFFSIIISWLVGWLVGWYFFVCPFPSPATKNLRKTRGSVRIELKEAYVLDGRCAILKAKSQVPYSSDRWEEVEW